MTFDTVGTETPACRAMSAIVVGLGRRRRSRKGSRHGRSVTISAPRESFECTAGVSADRWSVENGFARIEVRD